MVFWIVPYLCRMSSFSPMMSGVYVVGSAPEACGVARTNEYIRLNVTLFRFIRTKSSIRLPNIVRQSGDVVVRPPRPPG